MVTIGADMGGTKTDLICIEGNGVRTWTGLGVNVSVAGPERAAETLKALLPPQLSGSVRLCVGAAGAGSEQAKSAFRRALAHASGLPEKNIQVITDAEAALMGAFGGESGAVVIAGTGSGCYAFDELGAFRRTGGWGPTIGDPAGGHSIGRRAIQAALEDLERGVPTDFSNAILEAVALAITDRQQQDPAPGDTSTRNRGSRTSEPFPPPTTPSDLIRLATHRAFQLSELAPVILDLTASGDETALGIITHECRYLARQCSRLFARKTGAEIAKRIALVGGLTTHAGFRTELTAALLSELTDCSIVEPQASPAHGALQAAIAMT